MQKEIIQLYPATASYRPLKDLYLAHDLRRQSRSAEQPFVYANFISSIDGRIAVPHPDKPGLQVPKDVANDRDWRLFQELAVQADVIISSGRYLRDWAEGRAQEILQIDDPRFADLRQWRLDLGLAPQADLTIVSASLNFPIPEVLRAGGRKVTVFTTAGPNPRRVREIEANAGQVIVAGEERVDGALFVQRLAELGYRTIYSAAGPKILHMLLSAGALNRLYLTQANRLLGGDPFATIVDGPVLSPPVDVRLNKIYLDPAALDHLGQLLLSYDILPPPK